ncbi:universal stress protein [Sporichthya polymorpha]|uniref:universal stress protein n=1 Tax=Sporichthya polymorpha TaxID=35751 RepID=UPI000375F381|nr:universal stress protein [Sporichthya polymorpha]
MSGILVAVDGSASAAAAVTVAAEHAARAAEALTVVHVVEPALIGRPHGPDPLPDAVAAAHTAGPGVEIRALGRTGPIDDVLVELARDHDLLVVGSRGHGAVRDAALGSHAVALAAAAPCPVLVVRPGAERHRPGGPVVAALRGDPTRDEPVLDVAFAEATLRGVPVVLAHGVSRGVPVRRLALAALATLTVGGTDHGPDLRAHARRWIERHPDVEVRTEVRPGAAAAALLEAARGASLIVLGTRGRGTRAGLVLGSVSQAVLHHAHSLVLLVPPLLVPPLPVPPPGGPDSKGSRVPRQ